VPQAIIRGLRDNAQASPGIMTQYTILIAVAMIILIAVPAFFLARRLTSRMSVGNRDTPEVFAGTLLAEIDLYDRRRTDEAWSRAAVYSVLRKDIDRARVTFLARFPDAEHIFYSTLISLLARGDEDRVGTDYPYPRSVRSSPTERK
jgi:hypothetical protein